MARSLLAVLNRQMRIAARNAERSQRETERKRKAAVRSADQAQRERERAKQRLAKATDARGKQLEKDAAASYVASREAEAEELNLQLQEVYSEIDSLLEATLQVDDYVDLDSLRVVAEHPPFSKAALERPVPTPIQPILPSEPKLVIPAAPKGIRALFGMQRYTQVVAEAEESHKAAVQEWQQAVKRLEKAHQAAIESHARDEQQRVASLEKEKALHDRECVAREAEATAHNVALDKLAADLSYGVVEAVEEYVSIVLSNSVYPDHFSVNADYQFDPEYAELRLKILIPAPDDLPSVKTYKYNKSSDAITETALTQKACKDRYAGAVHQVALRALHEIFEADRRGIIQTISLEVGTETINPATGIQDYMAFVSVASERSAFIAFELSSIVPLSTLNHLGAAISKNPYGLVPVDTSGVRKA